MDTSQVIGRFSGSENFLIKVVFTQAFKDRDREGRVGIGANPRKEQVKKGKGIRVCSIYWERAKSVSTPI